MMLVVWSFLDLPAHSTAKFKSHRARRHRTTLRFGAMFGSSVGDIPQRQNPETVDAWQDFTESGVQTCTWSGSHHGDRMDDDKHEPCVKRVLLTQPISATNQRQVGPHSSSIRLTLRFSLTAHQHHNPPSMASLRTTAATRLLRSAAPSGAGLPRAARRFESSLTTSGPPPPAAPARQHDAPEFATTPDKAASSVGSFVLPLRPFLTGL